MAKGGKKAAAATGQTPIEPAPTASEEPQVETTSVRLNKVDAEGLSELARLSNQKGASEAFAQHFSAKLQHLVLLKNRERVRELEARAENRPVDPADERFSVTDAMAELFAEIDRLREQLTDLQQKVLPPGAG